MLDKGSSTPVYDAAGRDRGTNRWGIGHMEYLRNDGDRRLFGPRRHTVKAVVTREQTHDYNEARRQRALLGVAPSEAADRLAAAAGISGQRLMTNAGRGVAKLLLDQYADLPVTVVCGPGNNGGDGYVAARLLRGAGRAVALFSLAPPKTEDAKRECDLWCGMQETLGDVVPELASRPGVLVDALFGAGLQRPLGGRAAELAEACSRQATEVVSIDLPSGLCGDTGASDGAVFNARFTVALECARPGHYLGEGPKVCGHIEVVPIGLSTSVWPDLLKPPLMWKNHPPCWPHSLAKRDPLAHKYNYGHVLVVGGPAGAGGAARLAALGALRTGAGAVTLAVESAALAENASRLDAVMVSVCNSAGELLALLPQRRINAVLIGPGAGVNQATRKKATALLESQAYRDGALAVILDADALTSFEDSPEELFGLLPEGHAILTPHWGEFGRLFFDLALASPGTQPSAACLASEAAARAGATVVLKGGCTIIAGRNGEIALNAASGFEAAPWLATAGTGDVLAGLIGGLAARGFDSFDAAAAAAWLHAEAGRRGDAGIIADDLPGLIPAALARAIEIGDGNHR